MSFSTIRSRIENWQRYRAAVRELSRLSDRQLRDIGLSRLDIHHVASTSELPLAV